MAPKCKDTKLVLVFVLTALIFKNDDVEMMSCVHESSHNLRTQVEVVATIVLKSTTSKPLVRLKSSILQVVC